MKRLLLLGFILFAHNAFAQLTVTGPVVSNGSGCPQGTADVIWSPTQQAFTVMYSQLTVEATAGQASVNCVVEIPIQVPKGVSVKLVKIDHRGFINLNPGDRAEMFNQFLWIGGYICLKVCLPPRPTDIRKSYAGPLDGALFEQSSTDVLWQKSGCNTNIKLRAETRLSVINGSGGQAMIGIDSQDGTFSPETIYHVVFERCRT